MRTVCFAIMLAISPVLAVGADPPQNSKPEKQVERVAIDAYDLNTHYEVRGPLGVGLGKVITVKCKRVDSRMKGEPDSLKVTAVDGVALKSAVNLPYSTLPWNPIKLEVNGQYELRVYQTGGFDGIPSQAMKETNVVQSRRYGFHVYLVVVKSVK